MSDQQKPATGPIILEHILEIQESISSISDRLSRLEQQATQRHKVADARYQRTDQYIVGEAFNVDAVLRQTITELNNLRTTIAAELQATRTALATHLSTEGLARERNGH
jgi:hypothetical protein